MANFENKLDFFTYIRTLESRIKTLEQGQKITSLTLTDTLIVPTASSDPVTAINGQVYYNTTTNKFRGYENGSWANLI